MSNIEKHLQGDSFFQGAYHFHAKTIMA
jgi:hypothetical protein